MKILLPSRETLIKVFNQKIRFFLAPLLKIATVLATFYGLYVFLAIQLMDTSFVSGWFLMAVILILTFQARFRRLFSKKYDTTLFYEWHFILGGLAAFIFLLHLQLRFPGGWFEWFLAGVFSLVVLGGLYGVLGIFSKNSRLTRRSDSKRQEKIWEARQRIRKEAEEVLSQYEEQLAHTQIENDPLLLFYRLEFAPRLQKTNSLFYYLYGASRDNKLLIRQFNQVAFSCDVSGRAALQKLKHLYDQHYSVETRYAKRYLSMGWLLFHGPLAYLLFFMILMHILIVHAFASNHL